MTTPNYSGRKRLTCVPLCSNLRWLAFAYQALVVSERSAAFTDPEVFLKYPVRMPALLAWRLQAEAEVCGGT